MTKIREVLNKLYFGNTGAIGNRGARNITKALDQAVAEIEEIHEKEIKRLKDRIKELQKFRDTEFCKRITTTLRNKRR